MLGPAGAGVLHLLSNEAEVPGEWGSLQHGVVGGRAVTRVGVSGPATGLGTDEQLWQEW